MEFYEKLSVTNILSHKIKLNNIYINTNNTYIYIKMSIPLVIRIIGGVCGGDVGTYISGKIYEYISNTPQQIPPYPQEPPKKFESKIKDAKSFEEILNIQVQEYIDNVDKNTYEYDNEHGNTIQFIKHVKNIEDKQDVNDESYIDYYKLLFNYDIDKKT